MQLVIRLDTYVTENCDVHTVLTFEAEARLNNI
jgi:hypothetical protein